MQKILSSQSERAAPAATCQFCEVFVRVWAKNMDLVDWPMFTSRVRLIWSKVVWKGFLTSLFPWTIRLKGLKRTSLGLETIRVWPLSQCHCCCRRHSPYGKDFLHGSIATTLTVRCGAKWAKVWELVKYISSMGSLLLIGNYHYFKTTMVFCTKLSQDPMLMAYVALDR